MEGNLTDLVFSSPLAPPLAIETEPLNDININTPGQIRISDSGQLLKSYITYAGFTGDILASYDNFIVEELPRQLAARPLRLSNGNFVYFVETFIAPPIIETPEGSTPMYPITARQRNLTYSSALYGRLELRNAKGEVLERSEKNKSIFLGKIPVMVGSYLCHLHGKSEEERTALGECPRDPLGYFIIKGVEKIIFLQEKLRLNRYLIFNNKKKGIICRFTSYTPKGTTLIDLQEGDNKAVRLSLHFLGKEKTIPVFLAFRILLMVNKLADPESDFVELYYWFVLPFVPERYRKKIQAVLLSSLLEVSDIANPYEYLRTIIPKNNSDPELISALTEELFPQMDKPLNKLFLLALMTAQYTLYLSGLRNVDDRDSVGNKRFETAGVSLQQLFGALWNKVLIRAEVEIQESLFRTAKSNFVDVNLTTVLRFLTKFSTISDALIDTFTPGSWGIKGSYAKDNITDVLNRESVLSTYAQLTKINTPTRRQAKQPKIRMVQMSQLGFIDAIETPEGSAVGLVKHKAIGSYSSPAERDEIIIEQIEENLSPIYSLETPNGCLVNGKFIGWCLGESLQDKVISLRRKRLIPMYTSVVLYYDNVLYISTDASRLVRPLLIVEGHTTIYEEKNLQGTDFQRLLEEGAVEYVDAMEQDKLYIAQSLGSLGDTRNKINNTLRKIEESRELVRRLEGNTSNVREVLPSRIIREDMEVEINLSNLTDEAAYSLYEETLEKARNDLSLAEGILERLLQKSGYSHAELDPNSIFSISASLVPLPSHSMGPRNMYTCSMMKQALGIYHSGHNLRFDPSIKMLATPTPPLFATQTNEWLGLDDTPSGDTVIVALMPYYGYNQEDAFVFNKASIERGLFSYIIYMTYSATENKKERDIEETFMKPQGEEGKKPIYEALEDNGIARVGSSLKTGDVLISKTRRNKLNGTVDVENVRLGIGEKGVVERVLIDRNEEGLKLVKVKIREVRISKDPVVGDKFACLKSDAEVLTRKGWKEMKDLTVKDEVATLNKGKLLFEHPRAIHSYDYDGPMFKVSSDLIEQTVTPNHRMWVKEEGGEFGFKEAKECVGKVLRYKKNLDYIDAQSRYTLEESEGMTLASLPKDNFFTLTALYAGWSANLGKDGRVKIIKENNEPQCYSEEFVPYKGKVYCCTVSSGVFYMRENGKTSWTGNSRYAQKGTIGLIVPQEDMPFNPVTGMTPDLLINPLCFTGDTPVSLCNGLARRIKDMHREGGAYIWSWDKGIGRAKQIEMDPKGVKKVIKLTLQDGRILRCTPDHKLMVLYEGEYYWVKAGEVKTLNEVNPTRLVMGLESVLDAPIEEEREIEKKWSLSSGDYVFSMITEEDREKAMAFARILGLVLTDGCVYKFTECGKDAYQVRVNIGHPLDVQSLQDDIHLITGKTPKALWDKYCWALNLPRPLAKCMGKLKGIAIGKRSSQPDSLPSFLIQEGCPKSIIREFLGGSFGGDGHLPSFSDQRNRKGATFISGVAFGQSIMEKYSESMKEKMETIVYLLEKIGVPGAVLDKPRKIKPGKTSYRAKDIEENPRVFYAIRLPASTKFASCVGFRYCINKQARLSAANSYWRFQEKVKEQHDKVITRAFEIYEEGILPSKEKALQKAREEFLQREVPLNEHYVFSSVMDMNNRKNYSKTRGVNNITMKQFDYKFIDDADSFLKKIGCREWFGKGPNGEKNYITKSDEERVPTFTLGVVDIREDGEEEVYDISVLGTENFFANSICSHNCIPSRMTIGKLMEIVASKLGALRGERVNATAFNNFNIKDFEENLMQYGYERRGTETLINGITGKPFEAQIFIGPCYYMMLRHLVKNKMQIRSSQLYQAVSHQPVGGRSRGGALRIGNMEHNAMLSHGASGALWDSFMYRSDAYESLYCLTCGRIAINGRKYDKPICNNCSDKAEFGRASMPFAARWLSNLLSGTGIQIRYKFAKKETL